MYRYVALLRAINVGGHVVKMTHLRELFQQMGFANVETFIASGNVFFGSESADPDALEQQIESHLENGLGYSVGTFIRTPEEMDDAGTLDTTPEETEWKVYVAFLKAPLNDDLARKVLAIETDDERLLIRGREVYWIFRVPYSESAIAPALGKLIGTNSTSRNITTVRKIAAKMS